MAQCLRYFTQKLKNFLLLLLVQENKRDFTYVTDITKAFLLSATSNIENEIFNVGCGNTVSVNKIVSLLEWKLKYLKDLET